MNRKQPRFGLWAGAALAAGLLLRMWFIRHTPLVAGDSLMYGDIAKNWLQHWVYGFTEVGAKTGAHQIRPTLIRLPGYPLFLAACFRVFGVDHYSAVMYVQAAADLLTCWLASALAGRMFGDRAALAVLWFAALCPFTASYVATPLTETLVLTTIAAALYGFVRWQAEGARYNLWLWATAAALGYSILLRPEQVLFAAAILVAMLCASLAERGPKFSLMQSARPIIAATLCVGLPFIPWTIRN
jgi:4-amino-4-deoxy-L-arabinose transferase-like glycosyltransferase